MTKEVIEGDEQFHWPEPAKLADNDSTGKILISEISQAGTQGFVVDYWQRLDDKTLAICGPLNHTDQLIICEDRLQSIRMYIKGLWKTESVEYAVVEW